MTQKFPTHFVNSPLVEVVFEVRFKPEHSFASKALGPFLQRAFGEQNSSGTPPFEPMDGLHIPKELKEQDKNLYYVPSFKVTLKDQGISISDGGIAITQDKFTFPYQGWNKFRQHIKSTMQIISNLTNYDAIERLSLKYSDFIETQEGLYPLSLLKFNAMLGEIDLTKANFDLHIDQKITDDTAVVMRLCPSATLRFNNSSNIPNTAQTQREGLLFSTDCICFFEKSCINSDLKNQQNIEELFFNRLEELHNIAKQKFVTSFSSQAFDYLGANYE